jgi:hypothetical protein
MQSRSIRVYFRDNQHQESYLSFDSEPDAVDCVRRLRDRLHRITVHDCAETADPDLEKRIRTAAGA